MTSLRDLIFSQQQLSSQLKVSQNEGYSSPFSLRTLLSQGIGNTSLDRGYGDRGVMLPAKKVA
jgi:hypothetical protein